MSKDCSASGSRGCSTPTEKWARLQNPKCLEDYGLSLTQEDLRQFPEGRRLLAEVRSVQRSRANAARFGRKVAANITNKITGERSESG